MVYVISVEHHVTTIIHQTEHVLIVEHLLDLIVYAIIAQRRQAKKVHFVEDVNIV